MVSSGVGYPATGAKRLPAGRVTGTTALLATGMPSRCTREPKPYLRSSALANTCEALTKHLYSPCTGRTAPRVQIGIPGRRTYVKR
jgi:hypothetical protein